VAGRSRGAAGRGRRRRRSGKAREDANREAQLTRLQGLSALALANLGTRPDTYSLLSVEAFKGLDDLGAASNQSRGTLLTALDASRGIGQRLHGHSDDINSVAYGSDGTLLATASDDGTVGLWQPGAEGAWSKAGNIPPADPEEPVWISYVAIQPESSLVAVGDGYGGLTLWDASDPASPQQLEFFAPGENAFQVTGIAFNGAGLMAVAYDDGTVDLFSTSPDGADPVSSVSLGNYVDNIAFSPDGTTLAAGSSGTVGLWNVEDPAFPYIMGTTTKPHPDYDPWVGGIAFTPDGATMAVGYGDGWTVLWNVSNAFNPSQIGSPLRASLDDLNYIWTVAISEDSVLAAGFKDGTLALWDISDPTFPSMIGQPLKGHPNTIFGLAFSPDGETLASGSRDRTAVLWDVASARTTGQPLEGHLAWVQSVAFSPDGELLASGSGDTSIGLWDPATGQPAGDPLMGQANYIYSMAFSPDGETLASASCGQTDDQDNCTQGEILLWDTATRTQRGEPLAGHTDWVNSLAFSPDGKTLASGSDDATVMLWDVASGEPIGQPLEGHTGWVSSVAFSPDGKTLASAGDGNVILWDPASGEMLGELSGHTKTVRALAFSPDGATLASGAADGTIILWDVAERARLGEHLSGRFSTVLGLAFSPDGSTLASANNDQTVILWDPQTRQMIGQPLLGHTAAVNSVAFSPDGSRLASGADDNRVILWDLDSQDWIDTLCRRVGRNFRPSEWAQYFPDEEYRLTCPEWPAGTSLSTDVLPVGVEDGSGGASTAPTPLPEVGAGAPEATAAPVTEPVDASEMDALIQSARILVYEDTIQEGLWVEQALNEAGYSPEYVHDSIGQFKDALTSGETWDLIIVAAESHSAISGEFWTYIKEHLDAGAAVIIETWAIDLQGEGQIKPILEACGAEFQEDYDKAGPLDWYLPESEFFTTPNQVDEFSRAARYWSFQAGDLMRSSGAGDAVLLAGTRPDGADSAVITNCYDGRMILQTFSNHDYPQDQITPLWQNYVYNTLSHHFSP
jgi:WD40 repeat protein